MFGLKSQRNPNAIVTQFGIPATQTHRREHARGLPQPILIYPGEVHRVATGYSRLWIVSGQLWLTQGGRDIILEAGQQVQLTPDPAGALVSALHDQAVTLELR